MLFSFITVLSKRLLSPAQASEAFPFLSAGVYLVGIGDLPCRFFEEDRVQPRIEVVIVAHI
jgi:hypothetical protein